MKKRKVKVEQELPPLGSFPRSKQGKRLEDWARAEHRYQIDGYKIVDARAGHAHMATCADRATAILIAGLLNIDDIAGERYRLEQLRRDDAAKRNETEHT